MVRISQKEEMSIPFSNYLRYGSYVFRHKWHVLVQCWRFGILWRGLIHDWSKLTFTEWFDYARVFGAKETPRGSDGAYNPTVVPGFDHAWLSHIHHNKHHWQFWILFGDVGSERVLEMPRKYAFEMVADWVGAGLAQGGKLGPRRWYHLNKNKMKLHPDTRKLVEKTLESLPEKLG